MSIPILGQPKVGDWMITIHLTCTCGKNFLLSGKAGTGRVCECGKAYVISPVVIPHPQGQIVALALLNEEGHLQVNIGVGRRGPATDQP